MLERKKVLIMERVKKSYKGNVILNLIDLEVEQGEVVCITGANGSGKTTLLKIMLGFIYPDEGRVIVNGEKVVPGWLGSLATKVDALIENPSFMGQFTGLQNLSMLASIRGQISTYEIKEAMRKVGLDSDNKKLVGKYSLGMKQRLGIAQAIMENPSLVILDEPTNALDTEGRKIFSEIVKDMSKKGTSFVIVSHITEEMDSLSTSIYCIEKGQLIKQKYF
ncbi:MAG: ABC transporter ATP-binding protein [Dethiobacter sp.]|nr:ABC transporter ATP-binding protein [Dethiobacter sp.]MBS3982623.1 ABC transporter ATP-binding protein [Dethiobacter sp.]